MNLEQLPIAIEVAYALKRPIYFWGPPGVGKSDGAKQAAAKLGIELRDWRLSTSEPTDLKGFPVPDQKSKTMCWLPDEILPRDPKSKGILFLDEFNLAPPAVMGAGYQLILDRRLGSYHLPDGWLVMAAGNRMSDRANVNRMPSSLANRFDHVNVEVNFEVWRRWAFANDIPVDVIAFLTFRSGLLHDHDPTTNQVSFPTPRSWAALSRYYNFFSDKKTRAKLNIDTAFEFELYQGIVGEGTAGEFLSFIKCKDEMPDMNEVNRSPKTAPLPDKPSVKYAVISTLATTATVKTFDHIMKYVTRMPVEQQTVFVRSMIRKDRSVQETGAFQQWTIENSEML